MMEPDDADNPGYPASSTNVLDDQDSRSAVNSLILDYYEKFGRKRNLEQYFSLSTAQSEIRDPTSLFWRRMKMQNDSSDSGEKPSESSTELCRISIQCSIPVESSSQDEVSNSRRKSDSESPPIITEENVDNPKLSDNESVKSEDNNSQKSVDITLDTSMNKPGSPTSSVTSQRKLEWDSLADVGYAKESDRKTSGSSLSTLERLALLQQYSNNDNKSNDLGQPTAHSTLIDSGTKSKTNKRGLIKRTREIHSKDVDIVEFNVPQSSNQQPQSISVNLTKHISFNVEKDGAISVENMDNNLKVESPIDKPIVTDLSPELKFDKEIQTSLTKSNTESENKPKSKRVRNTRYTPVFISLNTLRRKMRKRNAHKKCKRNLIEKHEISVHEKSGEQVSEAESFEYMPGHIYNQNQLNDDHQKSRSSVGNKSSLESSGITTGSSKSNVSFTKDLDKSVKILDAVLKRHKDNASLKHKLVKDIVQKLVKSRYNDDESTTDFLSGLSYSSKRLGLGEDTKHYTTSSTSDANNTSEIKNRPRKSILRMDKFNANAIASTSQSAPNLPAVSNSENSVVSKYLKPLVSSYTESDVSSKAKDSSDTDVKTKTSSEELYQKYLEAVKREDAYKKHLRDKERFMKLKLLGSESTKPLVSKPVKSGNPNKRLRDLMKDLTSNSFDNGSGDASKVEKIPISPNKDIDKLMDLRNLRRHSVFTLSSGNTDKCGSFRDKERETRKLNLRKRLQEEIEASCSTAQGSGKTQNCCCPNHEGKCIKIGDGKVQLNIHGLTDENLKVKTNKCSMKNACSPDCNCDVGKSKPSHIVQDNATGDIKYVYCLCSGKNNCRYSPVNEVGENVLVYKCSRLINKGVQLDVCPSSASNDVSVQCCHPSTSQGIDKNKCMPPFSEGSQNDYVLEATRCMQTEVSINPKISEPSLTDVKMLYDTVCTKVSENYRKIEPKHSGIEIECNSCQETCKPLMPGKTDQGCGTSCQSESKSPCREMATQSNICLDEINCGIPCQTFNPNLDSFKIPLQGTNMTLMVSISKKESNCNLLNKVVCENQQTDDLNNPEKGTCLAEECTVGIQCETVSQQLSAVNDINCCPKLQGQDTICCPKPQGQDNICGSKPQGRDNICGSKPQGQDNIFGSKPQGQDNICSPKPQGQDNICGSKPQGQDNICGSKPQEQDNICSSKPQGQDNICGSKPQGQDKICSPKPQGQDNICGSKPQGPDNICGSKSQEQDNICSPKPQVQDNICCPKPQGQDNICCPKPQIQDTVPKNMEFKLNVHFDSGTDVYKTCFEDPPFKCSTYPKAEKKSASPNTDVVLLRRGSDDKIVYEAIPPQSPKPQHLREIRKTVKYDCNDKSNNATCQSSSSGKSSKFDEFISSEEQLRSTLYQSSKQRSANESTATSNDPVLDAIRNITKRYSKTPNEKGKRKKCFKEIMLVLKLLLETEDYTDTGLPSSDNDTPQESKCTESGGLQRSSVTFKTHTIRPTDATSCVTDDSSKNIISPRTKDQNVSCTSLTVDTDFNSSEDPFCKCGCGRKGSELCERKTENTKPLKSPEDPFCKCGCGKKGCEQCDRKTSNTKPCKVDRRDSGGQGECKRKASPPRKQTSRVSPRSNTPSPNRYKLCECGCGGKGECKRRTSSKNRGESSSACGSSKSTPRDIGGQGECVKNLRKGKDMKSTGKQVCSKRCSCGGINRCKSTCETEMSKYETNKRDAGCGNEQDFKTFLKKSSSRSKVGCGSKERQGSQATYKKDHNIRLCSGKCECGCDRNENCEKSNKKCVRTSSSETGQNLKPSCSKEKRFNEKACQYTGDSNDKCKSTAYIPKFTDKCVQLSCNEGAESTGCSESPLPCSSHHDTSDAVTCDILNKIKNECEKYHQTRCKVCTQRCVESSTTSDNYKGCQRNHCCPNKILQRCRLPKNKSSGCDRFQKKCVAYNLLVQTSESMADEDGQCYRKQKQLQNVVIKVPAKRCGPYSVDAGCVQEPSCSRAGRQVPRTPSCRMNRSNSWPNESELSSTDDYKRAQAMTCRDYLERNRPDFIEKTSARQNCLKIINETRANERDAQRKLLSLQLERGAPLSSISATDIRHLARQLGLKPSKKPSPKFMSERQMKKHSENIYKSLPEVLRKKEDLKKENIKKTNLLMANIFKKNLQRNTLRGTVNLSNYNAVIKL